MEFIYLFVVIFLFVLAVLDLSVGVSNDAVNFLTSGIGSRAGSFRRVLAVAVVGVFIGAAMSSGMIDVARHGIFHPEHFSFYDLMCIFMAVVVTNIILLDRFNTWGMPTSTTVSLIFELLGATFVVSLIKIGGGLDGVGLGDLINTSKALVVIMGIFLSVAIAFVFGTAVQALSRLIFTFNYRRGSAVKMALFAGVSMTAIVYFLIIKGIKTMSFVTPEMQQWINTNTGLIVAVTFAVMTVLMFLLNSLRVNVLKIVVLAGTFALAMAFAGNDLVNFIGVPLTAFSSYQDYTLNGAGDPHSFMMSSLNSSADTPLYFLLGAGAIMVVSLATSKKARKVTQTAIGLGSRDTGGDEMFGSSRIARRLVRAALSVTEWFRRVIPAKVRARINRRFNIDETIMEQGAAFDLVRASVNLVLAGALIALGTSLKLPLSTTFVTFMVAMGSSLTDKAWSRESAVFRITGVISVVGGWFLTAGAAFIGAGIIVALMHWGGQWVMIVLAIATVALIIHSNRRFSRRNKDVDDEATRLFNSIIQLPGNSSEVWPLTRKYVIESQRMFLGQAAESYCIITGGFLHNDVKNLDRADSAMRLRKRELKNARRRETLCMRQLPREIAIEKSAWFYMGNNCCMSILYNLRRITEFCKEHVENNFLPLPAELVPAYEELTARVDGLFADILTLVDEGATEAVTMLRRHCDEIKDTILSLCNTIHTRIREDSTDQMSVLYVYLNMLQETREMVSSLRKYLRAYEMFSAS